MNKIKALYTGLEKTLSDLRFAVIIITLFLITLVFGTFMESYHGADYASRLVYRSWWFIGIEFCMFLSILMATVVRLPAKKRLYGFYTIHSGLLILFLGSFFTYIVGIDGSLELKPNTPARKVVINEDKLRVVFSKKDGPSKYHEYKLPYTSSETNLDITIEEKGKNKSKMSKLELVRFIPFADKKISWVTPKTKIPNEHSSQYQLFNDNMSQDFTLSLSEQSDFQSMQKLGLLNLHYMPSTLKDCFVQETKSGFIIWDLAQNTCFTPESKSIPVAKTKKETRFIVFKHNNKFLKFFPDFSPMALNDDLSKDVESPFRVFSRQLFQKKPHLFLFGESAVFYKKRSKRWIKKEFSTKNTFVKLPWMGFKIRLIKHSESLAPIEEPVNVKPIHDNGKTISGNLRAVLVKLNNTNYWVRDDSPLKLSAPDQDLYISIEKEQVSLPYQITLNRFQMNTNPGTDTPASFESFVDLLDPRIDLNTGNQISKHHVFMNNPLKYDDFTFYQSSYFKLQSGDFASVLSVNYDPGRFFKYFGSFLIVFGSIWHYLIRRKKKKRPNNKKESSQDSQ